MPRRLMVMVMLLTGWMTGPGSWPAAAAPAAVLWERWSAHDPDATSRIDHGAFGDFLARNLVTGSDGINRIAYGRVSSEDASALDRYIERLARTAISGYARPEQMAYWINLYNALTVQVILDHYPVRSIKDIDISPGVFSDGPWGKKLVTIEGEEVALDDIEHQILRPIFNDPRIHYAVNCASIGCPNLQPTPFDAGRLDRQLDDAAVEFVNHRRAVDIRDGDIRTSSLYAWFEEDFGGDDRGVIAHLKAYAAPDLAMKLEGLSSLHDHAYDWRLNDATISTGF
ncbi:MAG: DUF547 domain-containing protein [Alphaproteobacteria bacterium]|nr:DUF547 domain-containing protein [Alphaproteobacteria bacterium]